MMKLFISICFFLLGVSCAGTKNISSGKIAPENFGVYNASSLAKDGISSYLIVPLRKKKYAIATNYALCGVILDGSFDGEECSEAINYFYKSKSTLELRSIQNAAYFDVIDVELMKLYSATSPEILVNMIYDINCIPINEGGLSHSSVKAAALITLGVNLVQTQFNEFELSTQSCEQYRNPQ